VKLTLRRGMVASYLS